MSKKILFTMDIDWTSEAVIKSALAYIKSLDIPCVLFQTHYSETINNEDSKLFTKELHPNFCENSDHGDNVDEIVKHLNQFEHRGIVIRAHKYNMPSEALRIYENSGFKFSMNNYTDINYRKPYMVSNDIYELNTFFEDGYYLKKKYPFHTSYILKKMINDGLYVFNVHPIHLAFNPRKYSLTRNFKDNMSKDEYRSINNDFIEANKFRGYGISTLLTDLITQMKKNNVHFISINEVSL